MKKKKMLFKMKISEYYVKCKAIKRGKVWYEPKKMTFNLFVRLLRYNDQCKLCAVDLLFWNIFHYLNDNNSICYHSINNDWGPMLDLFISSIMKNSTLIFEYWRIIIIIEAKQNQIDLFKITKSNSKIVVPGTFRLRQQQYSIELNTFSCVRKFLIYSFIRCPITGPVSLTMTTYHLNIHFPLQSIDNETRCDSHFVQELWIKFHFLGQTEREEWWKREKHSILSKLDCLGCA